MIEKLTLPKLGDTMEQAVIERWLVAEGDLVEKGMAVLEITTEKATLEVTADAAGTLREILAQEGETVPVGDTLAIIADAGDEIPESARRRLIAVPESGGDVSAAPSTGTAAGPGRPAAPPVHIPGVPAAPGPLVSYHDPLLPVEGEGAGAVPEGYSKPRLSEIRRIIAERMTYSQQNIPQFYLTMTVDMTAAIHFRKKVKSEGKRIGFNDMIIKAVAMGIAEHRGYTGFFDADGVVLRDSIDVGFAVSLEGGLIVPVIREADKLGLVEMASVARDLVERARSNRLLPEECQGSVFSVSNLGMYRVEHFTAIVPPGESGILAVGRIDRKPYVVGRSIEIRPTVNYTLTSDHRVVDGVAAAKLCEAIRLRLEEPERLM